MKVLVVADEEERLLYDCFKKERVEGVELIIACGDLKAGYLDFLMTMVNVPMIYVMGNHDDAFIKKPPLGAVCIEDSIFEYGGYKFAGLGGCMRYNNRGINMFTEKEMALRCIKLSIKAFFRGGVDVLVTHAPAKGYGDLEDLPHRGYECFNKFLSKIKPLYMFHGHVHRNYYHALKVTYKHPSGCTIVNGFGYRIIDLPEKPVKGKKNEK